MTKKHQSNRKQASSPSPRGVPWPALLLVGALVLIVGGGLVIWNASNVAPEVAGTPKLAVEDTVVDEGYLTYDTPIQTAFRLRNEGDGLLKILGQPEVVLAEGC